MRECETRSITISEMPSAFSACPTATTSAAEPKRSSYRAVTTDILRLNKALERSETLSCAATSTPSFFSAATIPRCCCSMEILPFESRSLIVMAR